MNKYGTPAGGAEIAKLPADQRKAMLDMMKKLVPQSYTITGKEPSPDGNRMVMRATGMGTGLFGGKPETQYATITLLKQGGEWKVDESNWSNTKPPAAPAAAAAPPAPPAPAASAIVPAPAPRPVADKRAPPAKPRAAAPAAPAASTALPRLGEARPQCVYKPVMTDEEIARCR
jgi:hypothetical protein